MNTGKIRVAIIFGGRSGEHSISCATAGGVLQAIDRQRFEPIPVGITPEGEWVLVEDKPEELMLADDQGATITCSGTTLTLTMSDAHLIAREADGTLRDLGRIDVVMPLLHGPFGEDGTIQGMCEMAGIHYTGCGVMASAAGMDKAVTKALLAQAGLPVGRWEVVSERNWSLERQATIERVKTLGLPAFVKPARAGSSLGISRITSWEQLEQAVELAHKHDAKVIVEAQLSGREVECGVLSGRAGMPPRVAPPGEIVVAKSDKVYDFESKYFARDAVSLQVPAHLPAEITERLQQVAAAAFDAIGAEGLSRVDFFYDATAGEIFINEINTMPGMTPYSLFPQMWATTGMDYSALVSELLDLALERPLGLR